MKGIISEAYICSLWQAISFANVIKLDIFEFLRGKKGDAYI